LSGFCRDRPGKHFAWSVLEMRLGRGALTVRAAGFIALLLIAALVPCLVHTDSDDSHELCLSFGPLTAPITVPSLVPAGCLQVTPLTVHQAVPVDLPVPPPEA
jgi:hypothetical protein